MLTRSHAGEASGVGHVCARQFVSMGTSTCTLPQSKHELTAGMLAALDAPGPASHTTEVTLT